MLKKLGFGVAAVAALIGGFCYWIAGLDPKSPRGLKREARRYRKQAFQAQNRGNLRRHKHMSVAR